MFGPASRQSGGVLVIVAPGQGAQTPGFLEPWLEDPTFASRFDWLSTVAGLDLAHYGTEADAETIRETQIAQPLLVATGLVAALELFPHPADVFDQIGAVAGHSVGELAAAAGARVITAEQAMVLVRERGKAMAQAAAATPTGMTAVLGGDRDEVLAAIDKHGLTAANDNGPGQIVAAGTLEQLAAFADEPPAKARLMPLSVAGAFHTEHMAPAVGHLAGLARSVSVHDPRTRVISNRDGKVIHDGREVLERIVGQIASPVRWDLCLETMADLGVTGILEMPPAGTLTGIAKRALRVSRPSRSRPPTSSTTPARSAPSTARPPDRDHPDLADGRVPRQGHLPHLRRGRGARGARARRRDRRGRQPARPHDDHRGPRRRDRRVAGPRRRPGLPRPAAAPAAPPGRLLMAAIQPAHGRGARRDPRHRRLPAVADRPQLRGRRGASTPATSGSSNAPASRSGASPPPEETIQMMSVAASRAALEHAGIDARQIDCVVVATVSHLMQTPAIATAIAHELGTDQAAAFDISAACAGFCHGVSLASDMVRAGSAQHVLVIGVERL